MQRCLMALVSLCFVSPAFALEIGEGVQFTELKAFNAKTNAKWSKTLTDIMNHEAPGDTNNYDDLITMGHETSHGIHAYIRNKMNNTGKRANGFYIPGSKAVLVIEPNMRKSQIAKFVPPSLRGSRYKTYITGQTAWDDTPLYVFDEWNAYVNGSVTGVDQVNSGKWTAGWRDGVAGTIEFAVYAIATGMAAQEYDPDYFQNYYQFKEFLAFNVKRSLMVFKEGAQMKEFKWDVQDKYYNELKTNADAEALRKFCRDTFGTQWTMDVLGF